MGGLALQAGDQIVLHGGQSVAEGGEGGQGFQPVGGGQGVGAHAGQGGDGGVDDGHTFQHRVRTHV